MLSQITIDNYALIDHLEMGLDSQLNIITGETGAGKSILLGALGLLLGNKNDGSALKDNTKSCVVEAIFEIKDLDLKPLFEERDWEWDESISVRRVISASGKSRAFINDLPVTLADLKELGARLIDIHSQHQNRSLSDESFRVKAIDLLADNEALLLKYRDEYSRLLSLKSELSKREESLSRARQEQEWLTYQVEELAAASLKEGEDAEAEAELLMLENVDKISMALSGFVARAEDDNYGLLLQLKASQSEFASIASSYAPAVEYNERLVSLLAELKDMTQSISNESERVESDPARLQKVGDRLNTIYSLCQKHRAQNLSELIEMRDRYAEQLNSITQSDEHIAGLRKQIEESEKQARAFATELHNRRTAVAPKFESHIEGTLSKLGMLDVLFKLNIVEGEHLSQSGADSVEFLFSANKGIAPQAVEKIASGGEISRVMLALKALLAQRMKLPTIIFDEIDTGVSGRIADAMGEIIESLSSSMQVVDITHLPQVASKGETHFVVYKSEGRTNISKLSAEQRVEHIAMMLSGSEISEAALEQARILLN